MKFISFKNHIFYTYDSHTRYGTKKKYPKKYPPNMRSRSLCLIYHCGGGRINLDKFQDKFLDNSNTMPRKPEGANTAVTAPIGNIRYSMCGGLFYATYTKLGTVSTAIPCSCMNVIYAVYCINKVVCIALQRTSQDERQVVPPRSDERLRVKAPPQMNASVGIRYRSGTI
jgi:hypothetical protein